MHGRIERKKGPEKAGRGITRRRLLIGGGAAAGLLVGWAVWPRRYAPNLVAEPGEHVFNAYLKIGTDGRIVVAVPQAEMGQGVYTSLPQILADELGADWRTVAVEPAPINPVYANPLVFEEEAERRLPAWLHGVGRWAAREVAMRLDFTITGGSSSIRVFEQRMIEAGAAARALLCMAAAERWGIDWNACDTEAGFVVRGRDRIRFAELAEAAAGLEPPDPIPLRGPAERTLIGRPVPRLDLPSKVDGSALMGADVRLPGMVYASIEHAPYGGGHPAKMTLGDAEATPGVAAVVTHDGWVAVIGTNWWAADRGLQALAIEWEAAGPRPDDGTVRKALVAALDGDSVERFAERGDADAALGGQGVISAGYSVPMIPHAPLETLTATARFGDGGVEIWVPTQAAPFARDAVAAAVGLDASRVTIYPTLIGGGFGRKSEVQAAVEAALIAQKAKKPVQLVWPRREDIQHSRFRPPAVARLKAKLGPGGSIAAWSTRIAAPAMGAETFDRMMGKPPRDGYGPERGAVEGATPPYAIDALAVEHAAAAIGVPTGPWRSVGNSYTAFFTESFIDELAQAAGLDPLSFRMQALAGQPRLARCLQMAASIGAWQGGEPGTGQGLAAHSCFGSHVAVLAETRIEGDRIAVPSVTAVVDIGRVIHPDIVRQQIEGGISWGLANAFGLPVSIARGRVAAQNFDGLGLPMLADAPEIRVEIIPSKEEPGGAGEIAVPPVAPAIANAVFAATGKRLRHLPLRLSDA
ncbi:xanthine dehydrogenase family protein molybdopterin-binding subunit [Rhizorhabdus dicambivorans]|uniref:Aldehyde oxidase n=1 Tax=Rhizorhabdus dicambivorans TaxID=1850238 RepID=A0A2A4FRC8_9SPHN|nr:molybdopterin cofactor-binding domain-containing protein [Rhizorhabdus dicambivorans]ATE65622.1 aldehyde oxidase [Rhizorhabdus dicambivorans]PCE40963.1 aldehyde oxidase [Rhizorhabdus dicambivorans]